MELKRLLFLIAILVIYLCLGSLMFGALERDLVRERSEELKNAVNSFIANTTNIDKDALYNILKLASLNKDVMYDIVTNKSSREKWDFGSGFGFAVSVVTTIGYGNMAPQTVHGKVVCVVYAFIGIPISIIVLSALGQKLAQVFARINKLHICSKKPMVNKTVNMVIIISMGLIVMFMAPAYILHKMENWGLMESLYFCFITLSTIGFGDYIIGNERNREAFEIAVYVWILFGLAYLSLVIKYITDVLVNGASKVERRTIRKLETEIEKIQEKTNNLLPVLGHSGKEKEVTQGSVRLDSGRSNIELVSVNHI